MVPPTIVKGCDIMTKSGVQFGEPPLNAAFYNPTTKDTFGIKAPTGGYRRPDNPGKSIIPLDYYKPPQPMQATTRADFPPYNVNRMVLNPEHVFSLGNHHFHPLGQAMEEHTTTHMATFTPKEAEKHSFDRYRMQFSSVPLGTMPKTKPGLPI